MIEWGLGGRRVRASGRLAGTVGGGGPGGFVVGCHRNKAPFCARFVRVLCGTFFPKLVGSSTSKGASGGEAHKIHDGFRY